MAQQQNNKYTFRGQRTGENIVLVARRHPWFFFTPGLKVIAAAVIVALVVKFAGLSTAFSIVFFIALAFGAYEVGQAWFRWINTTYVLTNERIIAVNQKNWLSRSVTEAPLENVMTVNHDVNGFIRSFLNFGNVAIRSSGATENEIVLVEVFDPFDVQQKILDAAKR